MQDNSVCNVQQSSKSGLLTMLTMVGWLVKVTRLRRYRRLQSASVHLAVSRTVGAPLPPPSPPTPLATSPPTPPLPFATSPLPLPPDRTPESTLPARQIPVHLLQQFYGCFVVVCLRYLTDLLPAPSPQGFRSPYLE